MKKEIEGRSSFSREWLVRGFLIRVLKEVREEGPRLEEEWEPKLQVGCLECYSMKTRVTSRVSGEGQKVESRRKDGVPKI